jgi:hypothetical protein
MQGYWVSGGGHADPPWPNLPWTKRSQLLHPRKKIPIQGKSGEVATCSANTLCAPFLELTRLEQSSRGTPLADRLQSDKQKRLL